MTLADAEERKPVVGDRWVLAECGECGGDGSVSDPRPCGCCRWSGCRSLPCPVCSEPHEAAKAILVLSRYWQEKAARATAQAQRYERLAAGDAP